MQVKVTTILTAPIRDPKKVRCVLVDERVLRSADEDLGRDQNGRSA